MSPGLKLRGRPCRAVETGACFEDTPEFLCSRPPECEADWKTEPAEDLGGLISTLVMMMSLSLDWGVGLGLATPTPDEVGVVEGIVMTDTAVAPLL